MPKLAEREATYKRRVAAGGADSATKAEIERLKARLSQIETEIAGLDVE